MKTPALAIVSSGMVSGVGLNAPASCAAIRCALDNLQETRFIDLGGEWIIGSPVPLEQPWRGTTKLIKMLSSVLKECLLGNTQLSLEKIPVLICVAEKERPGRFDDLENKILLETQSELGVRFHDRSGVIAQGRVAIATALKKARKLIYEEGIDKVIIAGVDTMLVGLTLRAYEERDRLLTRQNSNGFIPGEAAAAVLIQGKQNQQDQLICIGLGFGEEKATIESEDIPLRADGLVTAIRKALLEAHCDLGDIDFRITDLSGEQYGFKEASLALTRILRKRKEDFDIWHPADCIGEVGSAIGPVMLTVLLASMHKGYSPGNKVLAHLSNDDGKRVAMIFSYH